MSNNTSGITWKTRLFSGLSNNDSITFRDQSVAYLKIKNSSERTIGKRVLKVYNTVRDMVGDDAKFTIDVTMSNGKFFSAELFLHYRGVGGRATLTPHQFVKFEINRDMCGDVIDWSFIELYKSPI